MNLIGTWEYARRLARAFSIKERNPTPTLASEIVPVVLVEDLVHGDHTGDPEVAQYRVSVQALQTVGQQSFVELEVGTLDRIIVIPRWFRVSSTATTGSVLVNLCVQAPNSNGGALVTVARTNLRVRATTVFPQPNRIRQGSVAVPVISGVPIFRCLITSGGTYAPGVESGMNPLEDIVLVANTGSGSQVGAVLQFLCEQANTDLKVDLAWDEIGLPAELGR